MTARKAVATATPPRARLNKWLKASKTSCAIPDRSNREAINMKNGIATNEAVLVKSEILIIIRPSPGRPKFNHITTAPKRPDANPIGTPALNKIEIPANIPISIAPIPNSARKSVNKNKEEVEKIATDIFEWVDRDALMAQRRGTSQTSKATKEAIRNAQKKEVTKAKNKVITQKIRAIRR